jgi:hypothetical protein
MPLVWNGVQFVTEGGSDTEESDSEQPLTEAEQVVAILNTAANKPPPLPVDVKHTVSTAAAVRNQIRWIPEEKRTIAQHHALNTPVVARTVAEWIDQQLDDRRTERTIRAAFCFALNPQRSVSWVCKKSGASSSSTFASKGMALHLRCHPFTRSDVQRGSSLLQHYCEHREVRNRARLLSRQRTSDSLDAAVVLVGFHSTSRHFGAHRYRSVI